MTGYEARVLPKAARHGAKRARNFPSGWLAVRLTAR